MVVYRLAVQPWPSRWVFVCFYVHSELCAHPGSIVPVIILAILIGMGAVSLSLLAIILVNLFVLLWTVFLFFTIFVLHIRTIRTVIRTEVRIIWKMNEKNVSNVERTKSIRSYSQRAGFCVRLILPNKFELRNLRPCHLDTLGMHNIYVANKTVRITWVSIICIDSDLRDAPQLTMTATHDRC